jgi:hypothetical protein
MGTHVTSRSQQPNPTSGPDGYSQRVLSLLRFIRRLMAKRPHRVVNIDFRFWPGLASRMRASSKLVLAWKAQDGPLVGFVFGG